MVSLLLRTTRRHGVTFAHVVVENETAERLRVRLRVDVDGAVWPPRRRGVPDAGGDADGVTVTVTGGGRRGVGFATPTTVTDESVAIASTEPRGRVDATPGSATGERDEPGAVIGAETVDDATAVVRSLGSFAPPLAATPRERPPAER